MQLTVRSVVPARFSVVAAVAAVALTSGCPDTRVPERERPIVPSAFAAEGGCPLSHSDCDTDPSNGCEVDTDNDRDNCGTCGSKCASINGDGTCYLGVCRFLCLPGWGDCNGVGDDGCETYTAGSSENCGACGHSCDGGGCNAGACGPPPEVVSSGFGELVTVVSDGTELFVADQGTATNGYTDGRIFRLPTDGGAPMLLARPAQSPGFLALDEQTIYWTSQGTDDAGVATGAVLSVPRKGGNVTVLSDTEPGAFDLELTDAGLIWANSGSNELVQLSAGKRTQLLSVGAPPLYVAAVGGTLYFDTFPTDDSLGAIHALPLDGGFPRVLYGQALLVAELVADEGAVYWVERGTPDHGFQDGELWRQPLDGGTAEAMWIQMSGPRRMTQDEGTLYVSLTGGGAVVAYPKDGGTYTELAGSQDRPRGLVRAGRALYFVTQGGAVMRVDLDAYLH